MIEPLKLLAGTVLLMLAAVDARPQTATEIIAASDKIRNPHGAFRVQNTLVEYRYGEPRHKYTVIVYAKEDARTDSFRDIVRFVEPATDSGKMVLWDDEQLWYYDSLSKVSMPISPRQRLIGQASNGDVVTVNFSKDYAATILGEQSIQDGDDKERRCWQIDLVARDSRATYSRIEYWVEQRTYRPLKMKFYSDSGRILKIAYYRNFVEAVGATRPTEIIIVDAVDTSFVTTMTFSDFRPQNIPDAWFSRDYLPQLSTD